MLRRILIRIMKPKKQIKKWLSRFRTQKILPILRQDYRDLFEGFAASAFLRTQSLCAAKTHRTRHLLRLPQARFNKFWREFPGMVQLFRMVITRNINPRHGVILRTHYSEFVIKGKTEVPVKIDATLSIGRKRPFKKIWCRNRDIPGNPARMLELRGGYYEAICQLRGEHKDEMRKYAETHIHNYAKDEPNVHYKSRGIEGRHRPLHRFAEGQGACFRSARGKLIMFNAQSPRRSMACAREKRFRGGLSFRPRQV